MDAAVMPPRPLFICHQEIGVNRCISTKRNTECTKEALNEKFNTNPKSLVWIICNHKNKEIPSCPLFVKWYEGTYKVLKAPTVVFSFCSELGCSPPLSRVTIVSTLTTCSVSGIPLEQHYRPESMKVTFTASNEGRALLHGQRTFDRTPNTTAGPFGNSS